MPRRPDEKIEKAHEMFKQGMRLVDIAQKLGVPSGTVRRWKSTYHWESERSDKNSERSDRRSDKKKRQVSDAVEAVLRNEELSPEHQLFCLFYSVNPNATRAYQRAYNCSYESALRSGSRLLGNVGVREEIKRLKKERFENIIFDEHDIFQWYLDIATACITDYVTFGQEEVPVMTAFGPLKDKKTKKVITKKVNFVKFRDSSEVDGRIIKKVKMGKDGASIELHDAMKAMEWLTEHMDMGTGEQQSLAQSIQKAYEKRINTKPSEEADDT
jgi:phage terminase small subunit